MMQVLSPSNKAHVVDTPKPPSMQETLETMQANVNQYTRANDRRMVLRSLRDVKFLQCLTLDAVNLPAGEGEVDLQKLEQQVADEVVVVNGVPFEPVGLLNDGSTRSSRSNRSVASTTSSSSSLDALESQNSSIIPMLKGLCQHLTTANGGTKSSASDLYRALLLRLAPSADALFRLNSLLGSADLVVLPVNHETTSHHHHDSSTKKKPIALNIYQSQGSIHMDLTTHCTIGLFRKNDIGSSSSAHGNTGKPWISLEAKVHERANLSVPSSSPARILSVKLPQDLY